LDGSGKEENRSSVVMGIIIHIIQFLDLLYLESVFKSTLPGPFSVFKKIKSWWEFKRDEVVIGHIGEPSPELW
jgi:hypothetical protein